MKKQNLQDERVLAQKRKVSSEAFTILWFVLLASSLMQQHLFNAPFAQYAVEAICFIMASFYILVRHIMLGNDLFSSPKNSKAIIVVSSVVCGLTVATVNGVLGYMKYEENFSENLEIFFLSLAITFICATISALAVNVIIYRFNMKRQKQIEKMLNEEDRNE